MIMLQKPFIMIMVMTFVIMIVVMSFIIMIIVMIIVRKSYLARHGVVGGVVCMVRVGRHPAPSGQVHARLGIRMIKLMIMKMIKMMIMKMIKMIIKMMQMMMKTACTCASGLCRRLAMLSGWLVREVMREEGREGRVELAAAWQSSSLSSCRVARAEWEAAWGT
jgi:hypothetical protein